MPRKAPVASPRWLLLLHQLPARPSNLRVHVWRRLQQVGAIALRNSIYVLPNTPEAREDFDWIRAEITTRKGEVSILVADAVDGFTDDELQTAFRNARSASYDALIEEIDRVRLRLTRTKGRHPRAMLERGIARLRGRFQALEATDFFGSPRSGSARAALEKLERGLLADPEPSPPGERLDPEAYRRRQWVTRPRPGIDRMASAWLIRRFIAPDARFVFAGPRGPRGPIPFDMPDVEFGHHGSDCTFETLLRRFGIADPAAHRVGQLVHDLDLKESRYGVEDAETIGRLVEGLREAGSSDGDILESGIRMIEALYRAYLNQALRDPRGRRKQQARAVTVRSRQRRRTAG